MRVLWLVRDNLTREPGGDTTQIVRTAEALRGLGVNVDMSSDRRPRLAGYDLVHLFQLDRLWENEPRCRRIRSGGPPAVLSTIYWPADQYDRGGRTGVQGLLARAFGSECYRSLRIAQRWAMDLRRAVPARDASRPTWSFRRSARFCLETMSVLLPNSRAEQDAVERTLDVRRPAVVVPNAVGDEFLPPADDWPGDRQGVLCVGRIEPRKNQLTLIRALRGTDILLTLVGQAGRYSAGYHRRCRAEAGPNVRFVGQAEPSELRDRYRRSLVHVCPSWYETPGLVNLEAAVSGCAVVATEGGCTQEYLGEAAYYTGPDDPASMRQAVEAALVGGPRGQLGQKVAREFTWATAAARTLDGYRLALTQ
ncbi:MAG: glycosyltransferase family 4 protein [Planctomycetes bacterium]|nr:glycosyltransferase family 4 protein [Planctomycetota bacterium]